MLNITFTINIQKLPRTNVHFHVSKPQICIITNHNQQSYNLRQVDKTNLIYICINLKLTPQSKTILKANVIFISAK